MPHKILYKIKYFVFSLSDTVNFYNLTSKHLQKLVLSKQISDDSQIRHLYGAVGLRTIQKWCKIRLMCQNHPVVHMLFVAKESFKRSKTN